MLTITSIECYNNTVKFALIKRIKNISILIAKTENENTTNKEEASSNTTNTETVAASTNNPKTGDDIMFYVSMLGLSIIGLAGVGYTKKKIFNK